MSTMDLQASIEETYSALASDYDIYETLVKKHSVLTDELKILEAYLDQVDQK